jgi:ubiquinone/menaquinone biosynthesis C-methylase UbiE
MIPRTLEPEVMDTEQEAVDYDAMDHSAVNRKFVEDFGIKFNREIFWDLSIPDSEERMRACGKFLDAGTGTAQIPIELARWPSMKQVSITAVDMSHNMLRLAARNVAAAGLACRTHSPRTG